MENSNLNRQNNWDAESVGKYAYVEHIKKQIRRGNCSYIGRHPELRAIIRVLLYEMMKKEPQNIYEFAAALFNCNNSPLLVTMINKQLQWVNKNLRKNQWLQYDGDMIVSEKASTHSLLSRASISADIENILRYAMILRDRK